MMMMALAVAVVAVLLSCEKVVMDQGDERAREADTNVTLSIAGLESYSDGVRGQTAVTEACTRLCFAVYQDGERLKNITQKAGDADYGVVRVQLEPGTYQVLILGHSGKANPTTTQVTKIQFTNASASGGTGYTDTFYYYGSITVGDEPAEASFVLKRAVAMLRFVTNDVKPAEVRHLNFYYTGGSGALDATTGYGCVNSKQSVTVETDTTLDGQPLQYDLYTFLHDEEGALSLTVTATDADGQVLYQRTFDGIAMARNTITHFSGTFFTEEQGGGDGRCTMTVDTDWADTRYLQY